MSGRYNFEQKRPGCLVYGLVVLLAACFSAGSLILFIVWLCVGALILGRIYRRNGDGQGSGSTGRTYNAGTMETHHNTMENASTGETDKYTYHSDPEENLRRFYESASEETKRYYQSVNHSESGTARKSSGTDGSGPEFTGGYASDYSSDDVIDVEFSEYSEQASTMTKDVRQPEEDVMAKYKKIRQKIEALKEEENLEEEIDYYCEMARTWCAESMLTEVTRSEKLLDKLKKAIRQYPEERESLHRFTSYYIPETLELLLSYHQLEENDAVDENTAVIAEKVQEAVENLNEALETKIGKIYQNSTMDTVARADALDQILKQDGYVKDENTLDHDQYIS